MVLFLLEFISLEVIEEVALLVVKTFEVVIVFFAAIQSIF